MSDTVTLALRRIATAEGAEVSPFDTDTILAKKIYKALTGSASSRLTFVEVSRQIAQQVGATLSPFDTPLIIWRKALEARSGSTSRNTLLGVLQAVETTGLS